MPILLGHCQEVGHVDRLEIAVPDHTVQTGNCPCAARSKPATFTGVKTCSTPPTWTSSATKRTCRPTTTSTPAAPRKVPSPSGHLCRPPRLHLRRPRRPATPSHPPTQQLGHAHAVHSLCFPDQAVHDRQDRNQAFPPDGGTLAMAGAYLCAHHPVSDDEFLVAHPHPLKVLARPTRPPGRPPGSLAHVAQHFDDEQHKGQHRKPGDHHQRSSDTPEKGRVVFQG